MHGGNSVKEQLNFNLKMLPCSQTRFPGFSDYSAARANFQISIERKGQSEARQLVRV